MTQEPLQTEKQKAKQEQYAKLGGILMLSAWGIAMVVSSFLFLYVGYLIDEILGTTPNIMLLSFFIALGICSWKLYTEAKKRGLDL